MGYCFDRKNRQANAVIAAYFVIICIVLVWNLLHCAAFSWEVQEIPLQKDSGVQPDEDGRFEIIDGRELRVRFDAWGKPGITENTELCGAALLNYKNDKHLRFSTERMTAVLMYPSGETAAETQFPLIRQTSSVYDETLLYFAFDPEKTEKIEKGKSLELRIRSEGLRRNGVFFGSDTRDENEEAAVRIYYRRKVSNPFLGLYYFLLELVIGLAGIWMYKTCKMPLYSRPADFSAGLNRNCFLKKHNNAGENKKNPAVSIITPANVAGFIVLLLFMAFTFVQVIKPISSGCSSEILFRSDSEGETITLAEGDTLRQRIICGEDRLAGFGLFLDEEKKTSAPGDDAETSARGEDEKSTAFLEWKVIETHGKTMPDGKGRSSGKDEQEEENEEGKTILATGEGTVESLIKMREKLGHDAKAEEILQLSADADWLPLETPAIRTFGRSLFLELTNQGPGDVKIKASANTNGMITINGEEKEIEICLLAGYRNNGFMRGMFLRLCIVILFLFAGILFFCAVKRPSAAAVYLSAALSLGMIFSFMTPIFTISDERTHIDTVYMMSNEFLGIRDLPGPDKLYKRAADIDMSVSNTMPLTAERYRAVEEGLFRGIAAGSGETSAHDSGTGNIKAGNETDTGSDGTEIVPVYARTALENVPVFNYLPAAIGFTLARITGRNLVTMIMFARWMNLLACVGVMYAAVRRAPYGKAGFAVIGLFPKTLQQTASCSYDGMLIAGTCFFISSFLLVLDKREKNQVNSVMDLVLLIYSGCFVAANKAGTYLPITGLVLLLPFCARAVSGKRGSGIQKTGSAYAQTGLFSANKGAAGRQKSAAAAGNRRDFYAALLMMTGFCSVFIAKSMARVFGMLFRPSGSETIASGTRTLYSVIDFIHSPTRLVRIMINTLRQRGDGMLGELVGKNLCQRWVFVYAFLLLAFLGFLEEGSEKLKKDHGFRADNLPEQENKDAAADIDEEKHQESGILQTIGGRAWIFLLIAAGTFLIFLSMLLGFTKKGLGYVDGLQGRYFLPYIPLVFLFIRTPRIVRERLSDSALICRAVYLILLTFFEILCAYMHVW